MTEPTPYSKIDPRVRGLIRVLNRFPGVRTYTSCGGHPKFERDPENSSQCDEGIWYVDSHIERADEGHASLEFFAWIAYDIAPDGVEFSAYAKAPYLNLPGSMLFYRWAGLEPDDPNCTADAFAELLTDRRRRFYVTAHQSRNWGEVEGLTDGNG